ncbi:hypothetical protein QY97_00973 [Bacillus thermotolerans]|nr:hypothetical protein QY97_00973 [Bacillus thermotolerans]
MRIGLIILENKPSFNMFLFYGIKKQPFLRKTVYAVFLWQNRVEGK